MFKDITEYATTLSAPDHAKLTNMIKELFEQDPSNAKIDVHFRWAFGKRDAPLFVITSVQNTHPVPMPVRGNTRSTEDFEQAKPVNSTSPIDTIKPRSEARRKFDESVKANPKGLAVYTSKDTSLTFYIPNLLPTATTLTISANSGKTESFKGDWSPSDNKVHTNWRFDDWHDRFYGSTDFAEYLRAAFGHLKLLERLNIDGVASRLRAEKWAAQIFPISLVCKLGTSLQSFSCQTPEQRNGTDPFTLKMLMQIKEHCVVLQTLALDLPMFPFPELVDYPSTTRVFFRGRTISRDACDDQNINDAFFEL